MTVGSPSAKASGDSSAARKTRTGAPRVADGVRLADEYADSGYSDKRYLAYRGDGQAILLPPLLYLVLRHTDGRRDPARIAALVNEEHDRSITADGVRFLIEKKLEPLGLVMFGHEPETPAVAAPLLAPQARSVLVPARVVRAVSRVLAPLHVPVVVALVLAALVALDTWMLVTGQATTAVQHTVSDPVYVLVLVGLTLAAILFHEFGHASGCHYGGARPGAIGAGLYVVVPCFYTNVTDAYRLNRRGRLRTDLGGIYFNAIFIVAMVAAYLGTGYPPFLAVAVLSHIEVIQQLLPLVRLDGYYVLADLVGVPNLFGHVRPILRGLLPARPGHHQPVRLQPRTRRIVTGWVLVVVPFLVGSMVYLLVSLPGFISGTWNGIMRFWSLGAQTYQHHQLGTFTIAVLSLVVIVLPWLGLSVLLARLAQRLSLAALRTVRQRRPGRPVHSRSA